MQVASFTSIYAFWDINSIFLNIYTLPSWFVQTVIRETLWRECVTTTENRPNDYYYILEF